MHLPTSAVHYGSMVLHNFINSRTNETLRGLATHIVRDSWRAAQFGRHVISLHVSTVDGLTTSDIARLVRRHAHVSP